MEEQVGAAVGEATAMSVLDRCWEKGKAKRFVDFAKRPSSCNLVCRLTSSVSCSYFQLAKSLGSRSNSASRPLDVDGATILTVFDPPSSAQTRRHSSFKLSSPTSPLPQDSSSFQIPGITRRNSSTGAGELTRGKRSTSGTRRGWGWAGLGGGSGGGAGEEELEDVGEGKRRKGVGDSNDDVGEDDEGADDDDDDEEVDEDDGSGDTKGELSLLDFLSGPPPPASRHRRKSSASATSGRRGSKARGSVLVADGSADNGVEEKESADIGRKLELSGRKFTVGGNKTTKERLAGLKKVESGVTARKEGEHEENGWALLRGYWICVWKGKPVTLNVSILNGKELEILTFLDGSSFYLAHFRQGTV